MPRKFITANCVKCGNSFTSRNPAARYCSPQCVGSSHGKPPVTYTCPVCGVQFQRSATVAARLKTPCCSNACQGKFQRRPGITPDGYIRVMHNGRRMLEHQVIWEQAHGPIPPGTNIHHKDRNRQNNDLANLELMRTGDHARLHTMLTTWARKHECCRHCGTTERKHYALGYCTECYKDARRRN